LTNDDAADLRVAIDRLIDRVRHWQPGRWSRPTADGAMSRADRVHLLTQRLADAAADAERRPRRTVPRLGSVLALPDQVRVLAADVLAAGDAPPAALAALVAEVRSTAAALD
jgi:hypothetical protein